MEFSNVSLLQPFLSQYVGEKLIPTVLGDRKSLMEIIEIFAKVYGYNPDLHHLGSLEDLRQSMHESLQMNPADVMAWMPK